MVPAVIRPKFKGHITVKYQIVPVTAFEQNCSVISCEETKRAAVVDPGGDMDRILAEIVGEDLTVEKLLITHGHLDHAGATADLAEKLGVPIEGPHQADKFWIDGLAEQAQSYGFPPARAFTPDRWLNGGDTVTVGNETLDVIHCPGHTPGHVVFHHAGDHVAIVGDVLFKGSIGRTDFPQGNHADLIASITQKLWPLGKETAFVPGHGPMSTFGEERQTNPYVSDHAVG